MAWTCGFFLPLDRPLVGVGPCDRHVALVQVHELAPVTHTLFLNFLPASHLGASLVAQAVKNPPAVQETRLPSLGREDPLEKEMATPSSTLAWRIPWMEEPGGLQSTGSQSWK